MKIIFSYPPLPTEKGVPLLSQNRQFQYFKEPTYIYPVVPASAATLLSKSGFEVRWKDCIAENIDENSFFSYLKDEDADLLVIETKTPVVKKHWRLIDTVKAHNPKIKTVLVGDHVSALPLESFEHSSVDFVITGGDYDFLLLSLCKNLADNASKDGLEKGIYFRKDGRIGNSGPFELNHDLNSLPLIDRDLTQWELYAYHNGNFKYTPGTYIMSGRDCWWGKCSFCSWPTLYPTFRTRAVENVLDEIGVLVDNYEIKEIMDDTGTFPAGTWLRSFCEGMMQRGFHKRAMLDCNMRFGALTFDDYCLMKKAGFRLLLFGLESANQTTLDKIKKNLNADQIVESCKQARLAGLYPHITIMFGYPWEGYADALRTLNVGRWLLKKGYAYTVQATVVIPYPGTALFDECKGNNRLRTFDWDDFDMKKPVMKISFSDQKLMSLVRGIYRVAYHPEFLLRRLLSIRDRQDLEYFFRGFRKVVGHIFDFSYENN